MLTTLSTAARGGADVGDETAEAATTAAAAACERRATDNKTAYDSTATTVQYQPLGYSQTVRRQRTYQNIASRTSPRQ